MTVDEIKEPVIVTRHDETIEVSTEELEMLKLGPKFCLLNDLSEEEFEVWRNVL